MPEDITLESKDAVPPNKLNIFTYFSKILHPYKNILR
jgi:hypothetical protein